MPESPRLLISVRSVEEARVAMESGADIIDVKEPGKGSLGAASRTTLEDVARYVDYRVPLSAALGEWYQTQELSFPSSYQWAKIGFSQCSNGSDRGRGWKHWIHVQQVIWPTRLIGVVYADRLRAGAPGFDTVFDWIGSTMHLPKHPSLITGKPGLLIDTAIKDGRGLLSWMSVKRLQRIQRQCQTRGILLALAGSLTLQDVCVLRRDVLPDVVAVRGAACAGGERALRVQAERVRSLRQCLRGGS